MSAETALRLGLVTEVVGRDDLWPRAHELARAHRVVPDGRRPRARCARSGSRSTSRTAPRWSRVSCTRASATRSALAEIERTGVDRTPRRGSDERASGAPRRGAWRSTRRRPRWSSTGAWSTWGELAAAADAVDAALRRARPRRRARRSGSCCATGRPRSARSSVCCAPARAWSREPAPRRRAAARRPARRSGSRCCSVRADDLALVPADALPSTARGALGALGRADRPRGAHGTATGRRARAPGVAVRMLTSGTTGPPKRIDLRYEMLDLVMRGAKHYETRRPAATSACASGVVIVNAPLVHVSGVFRVVQAVLDGRRIALLERFTVDGWAGAVREHRPEDREPGADRAAHGARRRRRRRRVHQHPLGRVGHRAPRSRSRRGVHRALRRARAHVVRRHRVRRWRGGLEPGRPRAVRGGQAGQRRARARRAARCASSTPTTARDLGDRRRSGCSRCRAAQLGTDEWVRTTDLARLDADGFLWIVGRADQTILRGGYKVQPEVVRAALERIAGVVEAAVVGVADDRLGAVPVAAVERRPGAELDEARAAGGRERAPRAATRCRSRSTVVDALPRTASGKADLAAVRAMFERRGRDAPWDRDRWSRGRSARRRCPTVVELAGVLRDLTEHRPVARADEPGARSS